MKQLDPLLPEAQIDPDSRPAVDWPTDPWDDTDQTGSVERLRQQTRPLKWIVWLAMVVVVVGILVAGAVGWWYLGKINPEGAPGDVQSFTVDEGDDLESIALRLEEDGLVSDAGVFEWYVEREGGLELIPGYYQIRPSDHMGNVLGRLRTPPGETYTKVTFPEGFTLTKMADRLDTTIDRLSADDFMAAAADPTIRSSFQPPEVTSLEGMLFPDTYNVSNAESEGQVIERMIGLMERVGEQEDIVNRSAALGVTPYQALIIASMIEREARVPEDRAKIARVIYNRLFLTTFGEPFPLQIDATVLYGGIQAGLDPELPFSELRQIDTPWNSYLRLGLPATPIANPGRASIHAALNPAPDPPAGDPICVDPSVPDPTNCSLLYYVLADEDGTHAFAATAEQHQRNVDAAAAAGLL
ncbi:MAG: endolytic transglycosylase MltG [Ilumatobacteraceae bacterium]